MSLQLHATYTRAMAIASFNSEPQLLCDNQFAVFPDTILCFITVGEYARGSYLESPSRVIWKPSHLDYDPLDKYPWFPTAARETFDYSGREIVKLRNHHIEYPACETVTHSLAVQIARHFLGTGNLPDNVEWTKKSWDWDWDTEPTIAPSSIEDYEDDEDRIPF